MTAMTRAQAEEWADKAIRFNAIAPQTVQVPPQRSLAGEPQVAALALYLASGRGRALSGHVFEAEAAR
jgi:3-oxoacyl-[acyl-carrier protein] reductase